MPFNGGSSLVTLYKLHVELMPDVKRAKRIVSKAYYQLRERKLIGQCFVILLQTSHSVLAATITSTSVSLHAANACS
jgi:hypothetical protein